MDLISSKGILHEHVSFMSVLVKFLWQNPKFKLIKACEIMQNMASLKDSSWTINNLGGT